MEMLPYLRGELVVQHGFESQVCLHACTFMFANGNRVCRSKQRSNGAIQTNAHTLPPPPPPNRKNSVCKYLIFSVLRLRNAPHIIFGGAFFLASRSHTHLPTRPTEWERSTEHTPNMHQIFFWIYGDDVCRSCCWILVASSERKMCWLCVCVCVWVRARFIGFYCYGY